MSIFKDIIFIAVCCRKYLGRKANSSNITISSNKWVQPLWQCLFKYSHPTGGWGWRPNL